MRRQAGTGAGSSSLQMATSRPRDPMWYWKQNNIPFDFTEPEELARIREFCTTPDTLITMFDNTTRPGSALRRKVRDVVMGWTYRLHPNGGLERDWQPATVKAVGVKQAAVVTLRMDSGASVTCTPDHQWHNHAFTSVEPSTRAGCTSPSTRPASTTWPSSAPN